MRRCGAWEYSSCPCVRFYLGGVHDQTDSETAARPRRRFHPRRLLHVSGQCALVDARQRRHQSQPHRERGSAAAQRARLRLRHHPRGGRRHGQRQRHHEGRRRHHGAHPSRRQGHQRPRDRPAREERRHLYRAGRPQAHRRAAEGPEGRQPVRQRAHSQEQGRRRWRAAATLRKQFLAGIVCAALAQTVFAQFPERAIRLVVPQAAGSATDNIARIIAPALARELGQAVIVDNRPGGALTIGIDAVAKAAPDGYTLGQGPVGALAITRHMVAKLPYDIERDIQPVALVTTGYMLLAVSPKTDFHSVKHLIDFARKNPGKLSNASSSNGSPGHVSGELFKYMTGTEIVHIPYKGGAAGIADLISGQVQLMFESTNSIAPHVKAGRVRALAVTGERRAISLPEVPTLIEAGVPGYEVNAWSGIITTAGVPRPILDKLNAAVNRAIVTPDTQARLAQLGSEGGGGTPEQFAALIRRDSAKWAEVVRRSGARID